MVKQNCGDKMTRRTFCVIPAAPALALTGCGRTLVDLWFFDVLFWRTAISSSEYADRVRAVLRDEAVLERASAHPV